MLVKVENGFAIHGNPRVDGTIDIGDQCTHCGDDTSFGSGNYVNRVPSGWSPDKDTPEIDGYMCAECQSMECVECGELTLEYTMRPAGGVICDDCSENKGEQE